MVTLDSYLDTELRVSLRESRTGWKIHACIYAVTMVLLIGLNILLVMATSSDFFWFPFPLFGWGIGLTFHYLFGVRWAEREIRKRQTKIKQLAEITTTD
ncbi:MAG: 2TM domain-containing protein [Corynebacteriales bacterium]|nr:2TM domain-containing protein [Mycobacteriales bacterium]